MGKYMRKSKVTGEVAVMEVAQLSVGVQTRAKTLALQRLHKSTSSSSYLQLRSRRLEKPPLSTAIKARECCRENPNLRTTETSLHSSSASIGCSKKWDLDSDNPKLKEEFAENELAEISYGENFLESDSKGRSTRESTPCIMTRDSQSLETPGSTSKQTFSTSFSRRNLSIFHRDIPTPSDLEEFFTNAEKEQQRIFMEKYNYDPVNDAPLPGRYKWLKLDAST